MWLAGTESSVERPRPPAGRRSEDERLYLCWLDEHGGEELWATDADEARARCRALHGRRRGPQHCRCEPQ
ncbi:MAG TPA: hypothetical protein VIL20_06350 [Sandaracinaceae bacterium]